ncbi:Mn2+dependent serine/threonine protein kinase [Ferrimonas balearica DSM 9799]|uniref:non-specific serine/threonine protein kinase n=1 Tax=Ferrimonas balearica (strain DSM 9799 / CCM 4581 / KCTC 23876 / PAT) TaxID=550540 RepID=E1SUU2_FERBD|nr:RIO1 family regulatory kinase/ATPase [Ferrimonas balearica]ADN75283.1 Mn2+dependent serine/threonine protein kinase [Ferrimonas balearica DSM 9799]
MYRIYYIFRGLVGFLFLSINLRKKGYCKVRLFRVSSWHHGVNYYTCQSRNGEKFFIKSSGIYSAAEREYLCLKRISYITNNLTPAVYHYIESAVGSYVVMQYLEGESVSQLNVSKENFLNFSVKVVETLEKAKIIHRDIRPDNLIVCDERVILIDFGWSVIGDNNFDDSRHLESLKTLGGNYKPGLLKWNDAYSLSIIQKEIYGYSFDLQSDFEYCVKHHGVTN